MYFRQLLHDERSCASYVIGCPTYGVTSVVDPQDDPKPYLDLAAGAGLNITHVIDTHVHADHVSGAAALAEETGATLCLGPGAEVGFKFEELTDGEEVAVGNRRMKVLHTPGHTPEHVILYVDDWFVVTGDTLFVGDVGRVDLALSSQDEDELRQRAGQLHDSLQKLAPLADHIEVYPGHYSGSVCGRGMDGKASSTLGRERATNRALSLDAEDFIGFQLSSIPPLPEDFDRIKRANIDGGEKG